MEHKSCVAAIVAFFLGLALTIASVRLSKCVSCAPAPPIVSTPRGRFEGSVKRALNGKTYVSYQGIPYAKPPVGEYRFKRPRPLDPGDKNAFFKATRFKYSCWSVTKKSTSRYYNEDCLYLNVYVPGVATSQPFPVMVWIFGGGFVAGSPTDNPSKLVTRGDVIVVTIGYRLGVFGFLTNEDSVLPSNNGLWDQLYALQWVKENIEHFNGDTGSITLFGESAGAMSVALHALSPLSAGLFHRAVMQSGSATSLRSRDAKKRTQQFAAMVNCSSTTSDKLAACLRKVSVAEILANDLPSSFPIPPARRQVDFIWTPVVDGEFIQNEPRKLLRNTTYLKGIGAFEKDYLIGVLNDEGSLVANNFIHRIPLSDLRNATFLSDISDFFIYARYGYPSQSQESAKIKKELYSFYTSSASIESPLVPQDVLDVASDALFVVPATETALAFSSCSASGTNITCGSDLTSPQSSRSPNCPTSSGKTFFYHFDYCPASAPCEPPCMNHGSEVALEFPKKTITDPVLKQLSDLFVDVLAQFATTSDPAKAVSCGWPRFEEQDWTYLRLAPFPSVRQYLNRHRVELWLNRIPDVINS